ncbi:MAG: hypothetical protein RIR00_2174 [Pseudomonadota bacterium]|jgi:uncharacterized protein (TIGR00369 family)
MPHTSPAHAEHPERTFLRGIHDRGDKEVAVTTNPLAGALKMRIAEVPEYGRVLIHYDIDRQFAQGDGIVQGGICATMLDFGLAFAAMSAVPSGRTVSTIGLNVNYLRPAPLGAFLVEGQVEKMGRTVAVARASLFDPAGKLIATASSPLAVVPFHPAS